MTKTKRPRTDPCGKTAEKGRVDEEVNYFGKLRMVCEV